MTGLLAVFPAPQLRGSHLDKCAGLPFIPCPYHRVHFCGMLFAQALCEDLLPGTHDRKIEPYPAHVLGAEESNTCHYR